MHMIKSEHISKELFRRNTSFGELQGYDRAIKRIRVVFEKF